MRNRATKIIIAAVAIAVLVIVAVIVFVTRPKDTNTNDPAFSLPPTPVSRSTPADTSKSTSPQAVPDGCPSDPKPITNPSKFEVVGKDQQLKMMTVGVDDTGAAGAPPGNEGYTVAWFNGGPEIGSRIGKVVLTSHTFRFGGALGNELNNGAWQPGQVIKISDDAGNSACYRYTNSLHILVKDYDPNSTILYDYETPKPEFAIVVCSDYVPGGDAEGRMIYYADLIHA